MMARRYDRSGGYREPARAGPFAAVAASGLALLLALASPGYARSGDAGSALVPAPRADLATPPPDDGVAPPPAPAYDGDVPAAASVPEAPEAPAAPVMTGAGSSIMVTLTGGPSDAVGADSTASASAAARHSHWRRVGSVYSDTASASASAAASADSGSDQVLELPRVVDTNPAPSAPNPPQQTADMGQTGASAGASDQIGSIQNYQDQYDMSGMYPAPISMGPVILNPMMAQQYGLGPYASPAFPQPPIGAILPSPQFGGQLPPGPYIVPPEMNTMRSAVLPSSPMWTRLGGFARYGGFGRAGGFARRGGFGRAGGFRMGVR